MKLWLLVVSMVEESVNSVLLFWKAQAGMSLTTTILNLSSSDKAKVATSSINNAAAAHLSSMNSVLDLTEAALLMVSLVADALVTPRPTDADTLIPKKIIIAKVLMLLIMPDSLIWNLTEEPLAASASKVL